MSTTTVKPSCPRCGFSYAWDGACCGHCHYQQPVLDPPPQPSPPPAAQLPAFLSDPTERGLLEAIREDPDDEAVRLIYADWLEERGDVRGELLRAESMLATLPRDDPRLPEIQARCERLAMTVDRMWYVALESMPRKARILNCGTGVSAPAEVRFVFRCPNRWNALRPTAEAGVRYCEDCRREVFHCDTQEQAREHAVAGHCIAITGRLVAEVERDRVTRDGRPGELMGLLVPTRRPLPLVDDNNDRFRGWGQELLRPTTAGRKRWWQFWR